MGRAQGGTDEDTETSSVSISETLQHEDDDEFDVVRVRIIKDNIGPVHTDTAEYGDGQTFFIPLAAQGVIPVPILQRRPQRHRAILYAGPLPSGVSILLASRVEFLQVPNPTRGYTLAVSGQQLEVKNQQPWYGIAAGAASAPATPAVPASTVAAQNTNAYPVTVVVTGGAATVTTVNGIVVGAGDGTFLVPSGGSIAITYTVAPAWAWSNAAPNQAGPFSLSVLDEGWLVG
jgi:hypothetical protein